MKRGSWRPAARFAQKLAWIGSLACSLGVIQVLAQDPPSSGEPARRSEPAKQSAEERAGFATRRAGDLVADNLDRVAATAEQLLEILKKDPGLMVEFKRLLAQDSGADGQLLEEADLTDDAITERLNSDLHSRVLATRLLRRYGYLTPKVNPDSDLAAEHNLVLQDRAYALARAAERSPETRTAGLEQTGCSTAQGSSDCSYTPAPAKQGRPPVERPDPTAAPPADAWPQESAPSAPIRTETGPQQLRASFPSAESSETSSEFPRPPGSGVADWAGATDANRGSASSGLENPASIEPTEAATGASFAPVKPETEPAGKDTNFAGNRARYESRSPELTAAAAEPVRMVHKPNPYADTPALYDLYVQAAASSQNTERFGLAIFRRSTNNTTALPMDLPVGPDYVIGPGDGLSIDLWGGVSQRLFRTVDREGRVLLPEAGPLLVSGKSLGEVQESVQRVLRTQFRDVSADVSLLRLRTVRVYVVGEVAAPGAYDVSSLSTPLNALFAAGGVTARGSLRSIEHYRGKELVEEVDAYDLLLHGVRGSLQRLENGDSLRVPPLGPSIAVDGMVRRPATYELHGEKNLNEVLELAGGILPAAEVQHIEVQRTEAHLARTMLSLDVGETSDREGLRKAFEAFAVQDGDEVHIFPIAPYNSGGVYLEGHVLRPGRYSYRDGMKLTDLVASYKELLPEPAAGYAEIVRISGPDKHPVVLSFNLATALANAESAPPLQPLDTVRIFGRYDLEAPPEIQVGGEVRAPGRYRISGQEHLRDAIYQAAGTTAEAWLDSAQLFRTMPDGGTKVFSISLGAALAGDPLNNILVEPRDRILVHREPERVNPPNVYIRGEVGRPGRYPLGADMHISDLVAAAGGLLRSADGAGAALVHYATTEGSATTQPSGEQPVNLTRATGSDAAGNALLRDGDVLTVPQRANWKDVGATVTLHGEVAKPGVYGIEPGERLSSLLARAGGLLRTAYPQAAVFERLEVRKLQEQSRQELIQRLEQESTVVKTAVSTSGSEEAALQQAALQQRQRVIDALRRAPVSGRLVVHIRTEQKNFAGSPDDIELRAGDTLEIPKQPGFVLIVGQVYNSNAITYTPGRNAAWYLSRAGGATGLANRKAIFIIRASGAVSSGSSGMWSGGVLSATIGPGDTIVVPERSVVGGNVWKNLVAIAQIAQAAALAAAVAIP